MVTKLGQALRVAACGRPLLVARAEKKQMKRRQETQAPTVVSKDIINIFVKKTEPVLRPLKTYPRYLRTLVYDDWTAPELCFKLFEGYQLTVRDQWKVMLYLKRTRMKTITEIMNMSMVPKVDKSYDENDGVMIEDDFLPSARYQKRAGVGQDVKANEQETKRLEAQKKAEELKKKRDEERKAELEEKKLAETARKEEARAIRKKGVKIKGKRVVFLTREDAKIDRREHREKKRLQKMSAQDRERYLLDQEEKAKKEAAALGNKP